MATEQALPAGPAEAKRLFLLDGHSLSYRAFFALPPDLATKSGQVTNAVYGFTSMLIKLLGEERPDMIAVAFDAGKPTVRLERYADYKAGRRETPDDLRQQLGLIREVLETMRIPIVEPPEGHEADDVIATLALRAREQGVDVVIVTADRDFFQLVRPGITVMFNRRGISDIVRYDQDAVTERFGLPPAKYLDYVALKGDASDNIPGIPGVGEKTASRLIQDFGSVEALLERSDQIKGKLREAIQAAADTLALNKDLARLQTDLPVDLEPDGCVMGEWDPDAVRRLFNSLEFRTLLERLEEIGRSPKPVVEAASLDVRQGSIDELVAAVGRPGPKAVHLAGEAGIDGVAVSAGGGQALFAPVRDLPQAVVRWLADPAAPKWVHDAKEVETRLRGAGCAVDGVAFDTLIAGFLLDPAEAKYPLDALCRLYLGIDVLAEVQGEDEGQLFADPSGPAGASAAAVALLAPVMQEKIDRAQLAALLADVELPLSSVLAKMQAAGIALDVEYLREMSDALGSRLEALEKEIFDLAGEPFNIGSPQQMAVVLYDRLHLPILKRTQKGRAPSTDADVLEKLRDRHPIVAALLDHRELFKLKSTYLDALPPLVAADGRVHTTFNQVGAATGRISSVNPNLQNIPVRGETGRQIRLAFVAGGPGRQLLVADYSQIELRVMAHLSGDEAMAEAFAADVDFHAATAAKVFDVPLDRVDGTMRSRVKQINYGLPYGMNAYGLASRIGIAPDEAQEFIDAYFAQFPRIREFLDRQVARAAAEGFTATILGRRRYLPELQSANPRIRDMGRRMALNAPIQGSAADILKLAMIGVDRALGGSGLDCTMVLTVHDELVFDVAQEDREAAGLLVKAAMESAYPLSVPLRADLGWGRNWAEAAPAGH